MSDRSRSWLPAVARWAPLALAAVVLIWHAQRYDFVTDDAYISFVFARNLAEHGQLSFNLGDPVEGYTNFLWTFILGLLMVLGVPAPWASQVLGVGFGLGTLYLVFRIGERLLGRGAPLAGLPPLLLACSSGFACWSSGGLETQLYTFLIALALDAYLEAGERPAALRRMAIALALAAMTRPEGLLLAALFVVHRLGGNLLERRWRPSKDELVACAWFLGLWAPWFAWRWWYYGWPFPNTYYVKAAGAASPGYEAKMHGHGWHYVSRWVAQTSLVWAGWLLYGGLFTSAGTAARTFVTLTVPIAAVYLIYAASVGGDFMGLHRFIMPLFVIAAILVALGLERLLAVVGLSHRWASAVVGVALVGAVAIGFALDQQALTRHSLRTLAPDRGIDTPGYLKLYAHDRLLIGEQLRPCLRPDDFAIYGGVGALPWTARLPGVDVFGLVSDKVAHQVPRSRDRPGHNKWAPDALLAEYRPTIILHCYDLRRTAEPSPLGHCDHGYWERAGFERLVLHVPGLRERGEYLTFLARRDRALACPGLSR